jgi:hypothetical protein
MSPMMNRRIRQVAADPQQLSMTLGWLLCAGGEAESTGGYAQEHITAAAAAPAEEASKGHRGSAQGSAGSCRTAGTRS